MKKILLIAIFALVAVNAFAQDNLKMGVRFDMDYGFFTGDSLPGVLDEISTPIGASFDVLVPLAGIFSIHPSLGISYYFYEKIIDKGNTGGFTIASSTQKIKSLDFISLNLPVFLRVNFTPSWFVEAGPKLDLNLAVLYDDYSLDYSYESVSNANTLVFGLGFGVGYQFEFGLSIDVHASFGLTDIFDVNAQPALDRPSFYVETSQIRLGIAMSYWLKR